MTVNAVDANWNLVNTITDTVAITSTDGIATLPANAALVAGTRTFSVTLKTAPSQTVTATDSTDGTKTANTSPSITVGAGAATHLAFGQQPTNTPRTQTITPAVTVRILDANNNLTTSTANVTLAIGTNPGGGTLSGTLTQAAVAGVATFANLSINNIGTGYTLAATSTVTGVTSDPFNITFLACSWKTTGTTGGSWVTGSNWTGCAGAGGIPATTDDVVIPASNTNPTAPSTSTIINSLSITTGNLTINSGGVLIVSTDVTNTGTLSLVSTGVLTVRGVLASSGTFSAATTSSVEYDGLGNQNIAGLTYGILRLKNGGIKSAIADFTVAGNTFSIDAASTFNAASFTQHFQGSITNVGTYTAATSTAVFDGSGLNPNFGGSIGHVITFNNVVVNRTGGSSVSVVGSGTAGANVAGDLTITSGTLDLAGNTLDHTGAGTNTLTVANGAFLRIAGANAFPSGFTTIALAPTSTVEYYAGTQTVAGVAYGHLTLSGTASTLAGNASVAGTLALNAETLTTGANTIAANGTVTRSTGFVIGNLQKPVSSGSNVRQDLRDRDRGGLCPGHGDLRLRVGTGHAHRDNDRGRSCEPWHVRHRPEPERQPRVVACRRRRTRLHVLHRRSDLCRHRSRREHDDNVRLPGRSRIHEPHVVLPDLGLHEHLDHGHGHRIRQSR